MSNEDLCYLSATEALKLFESRKLSPRELMAALIARIERVNPGVNCFADRYFDEAMDPVFARTRFSRRTVSDRLSSSS